MSNTQNHAVSQRVVRLLESTEARMYEEMWPLIGEAMARRVKPQVLRVAGALLTIIGKSTSLRINRVLDFDAQKNHREETIDEIIDHFKKANVKRFCFHLGPGTHSELIDGWLRKRGFKRHTQYLKLVRKATDPPAVKRGDLSIRRIDRGSAQTLAEIACNNLMWPVSNIPWMAATVGQPGFDHYMAFSGEVPAATGLLFAEGKGGWLGWGATEQAYRRKGAQAALIAARVRRAGELGCEYVCSETGETGTSYNNLVKNGFELAYRRPIYLWES